MNSSSIRSWGDQLSKYRMAVESFDSHMAIADQYDFPEDRSIVAVKTDSELFSAAKLKTCLMCRAPLPNIQQYIRPFILPKNDTATARGIQDLRVEGTRNEQIAAIRKLPGLEARYIGILKLRRETSTFLTKVSEAE